MLKCYEVMTSDVAYCAVGTPVQEAAQKMRARKVGSLPVVDGSERNRVLGIITDRDLAVNVIAEALDAKNVLVDYIMTKDPVCCNPDDTLDYVLDLMEEHEIRRVPIVNRFNQLVGIISETDLADLYLRCFGRA